VKFPEQKRIIIVSCGSYHTIAIGAKGEIFSFGRGDKGQLGFYLFEKTKMKINEKKKS
jgi:alpha-tubulin suppressor-like RCC1 family protein